MKQISVFILACLAISLMAGSVFAEENSDSINLITGIGTKGNQTIPAEEILSVVQTKVGDEIDNEILRVDLQAIFDLGYFFNVSINFESYLSGVKLVFEVVENPKVSAIHIKGTEVISEQKLKEIMTLKPGEMLNTKQLNQDLRTLEDYYKGQGLVLAYIEDVAVSDDGVLNVKINEGFLKDIKIMGNEKTRDYVIRRELKIQPGEVFDLSKVQDDLRRIYNLGFFNNVQPRIEKDTDGSNKVNLIVEVEEKKTGAFNVGGGYSSKDGWLGYMEVKEQNLFGRGQQLGFKWEFGQAMNYELSFYDPWIFGEEYAFGIDLYNNTKNDKEEQKTVNSSGGSILVGKALTDDIKANLKFKYEYTNTSWDASLDKEAEIGDTRSLILSATRNTVDNPFTPHTGSMDIGSIEYAGQIFGGTYDFTKLNLENRRYFPGFKEDHTWAFRLKSGIAFTAGDTEELPDHEKYRLGGGETLRGYSNGAVQGNRMLLANLEYRFPLVSSLEGTVFTDMGNAWEQDEAFDLKEMNFSFGAGVRMNTPLGQIRVDYAFGEEEDGFPGMPHFSIGQTF